MSEEVTVSYPARKMLLHARVQTSKVHCSHHWPNAPEVESELYIGGTTPLGVVDGTMRSVTHLWTNIDGLGLGIYLNTYWETDNEEEKMNIWSNGGYHRLQSSDYQ